MTPHRVSLADMVAAHCLRHGRWFCVVEFTILAAIGGYMAAVGHVPTDVSARLVLWFDISLAVNSALIAFLAVVARPQSGATTTTHHGPSYTGTLVVCYLLPFAAVLRYLYDAYRRLSR